MITSPDYENEAYRTVLGLGALAQQAWPGSSFDFLLSIHFTDGMEGGGELPDHGEASIWWLLVDGAKRGELQV